MTKTIRHVSELPDWFDIRHYEQWEDKPPYEAAQAVDDRLWIKDIFCSGALVIGGNNYEWPSEAPQAMLKKLAETSANPYQRSIKTILVEIFRDRLREPHERDQEHDNDAIDEAAMQEAKRIFGSDLSLHKRDGIDRVTLWDITVWMEENEKIISEIERSAKHLSHLHGWPIDVIRGAIQQNIPIFDSDGSDCLVVNDYPTIPTVLKRIEDHLLSLPVRHNDADKARYSDVRKLFEYRVAAYADLMSWSYLTGCTITKKCLANALFPDGRYGEIDMMPSKTVGRFIQRVERGYIEDLTAKAAEMKSMQS